MKTGEAAKITEASDLQKQQDIGPAHKDGEVGQQGGLGWVRKRGEFEVPGLFIFSWTCPGAHGK